MHFEDCAREESHNKFEVINADLLPKIIELEALQACNWDPLTVQWYDPNNLMWACSLCVGFEIDSPLMMVHLSSMYVFYCKRLFVRRMADLSQSRHKITDTKKAVQQGTVYPKQSRPRSHAPRAERERGPDFHRPWVRERVAFDRKS